MVVYTGAGANLFYEYESTFGTAPTINTSSQVFGLNGRVTSLSLTNNRIDINKLGQVEPTAYAYGQQTGRLGVGFIFDSRTTHKIFEGIYGTGSGSAPIKYPATHVEGGAPVINKSFTTQIQLQTGANYIQRQLLGCITNSVGISTSIGEAVNGTLDATFGKELAVTTASSASILDQTGVTGDPLTFAHGTFLVSNGTATLQEIGEIQSFDMTFNQNAELLYKLGQHHAAESFRKVLDISGSFKTSWQNTTLFTHILNQANDLAEQDGSIPPVPSGDDSGLGAKLTFTHAGDSGKSLVILLKGISFGEHSVTGLEPVEPVFEELPFKCKSAQIQATV